MATERFGPAFKEACQPTDANGQAAAWNRILEEREELKTRAPAAAGAEAGPRRAHEEVLFSACDAMWQGLLLVDDNDDVREMYAHMLRSAGFEVRGAADGEEALAAADARPAVIIMDLAMPGLNGWEATRRLKTGERTKDIPIIVLTAHALDHYRDVAVAAGCDAFLSKPCALDVDHTGAGDDRARARDVHVVPRKTRQRNAAACSFRSSAARMARRWRLA